MFKVEGTIENYLEGGVIISGRSPPADRDNLCY